LCRDHGRIDEMQESQTVRCRNMGVDGGNKGLGIVNMGMHELLSGIGNVNDFQDKETKES
jgi:hypothetical protein